MLELKLQELGLEREEAQIYLCLLTLGGGFVSVVAKKTGIPRVNCYYILDKLKSRGLVSSFKKKGTKFFVAEPPQVLLNQYEDKFEKARKILPDLQSVANVQIFKPVMRSYEGIEGIKTIFDQTLLAESEVLGYTNLGALDCLLGDDYLRDYARGLVKNKVKTRWLSPSTQDGLKFLKKYYPANFPEELVEILFVDPTEFNFENQIAIYDNTVAIMSLNQDELVGVVVESAVHARTQKAVFNLAWLGATSFVA